jgi:hypothetical protein
MYASDARSDPFLAKLGQTRLGTWYRVIERLLHSLVLRETENEIIADSQHYWEQSSHKKRGDAHWRGKGVFEHDDERWLAIGRNNLDIFERLAGKHWLVAKPRHVVEWGSGGGANAVHFGRGAARYYGVDIDQASLDECRRQMLEANLENFVPVLFQASDPERVADLVQEKCELMLSTYVYELLPSKVYGYRVLRIAFDLLEPGGLMFVQIKYSDLTRDSQPFTWGYAKNVANMTTYRIEEFWTEAEACGFCPQAAVLEPEQPLVHDRRYAYYLLRKDKHDDDR